VLPSILRHAHGFALAFGSRGRRIGSVIFYRRQSANISEIAPLLLVPLEDSACRRTAIAAIMLVASFLIRW